MIQYISTLEIRLFHIYFLFLYQISSMKRIKYLKEFKNENPAESLFEMDNIRSKSSGLPMLIWVSEKNANHGPRIKVARDYRIRAGSSDTFSVSISKIQVLLLVILDR